jgi:DNA mismatch repair protein MutS
VRRVQEGATDRSYGIHVARLAGVPDAVVERARAVLKGMEAKHKDLGKGVGFAPAEAPTPRVVQLPLFGETPSPVVEEVRRLDPESMTPLEALNALARLKAMLAKEPPDPSS